MNWKNNNDMIIKHVVKEWEDAKPFKIYPIKNVIW